MSIAFGHLCTSCGNMWTHTDCSALDPTMCPACHPDFNATYGGKYFGVSSLKWWYMEDDLTSWVRSVHKEAKV